jgi:hypothetical protein
VPGTWPKRFLDKGAEWPERPGEAEGHQHRQGADLRRRSHQAEEGRETSAFGLGASILAEAVQSVREQLKLEAD